MRSQVWPMRSRKSAAFTCSARAAALCKCWSGGEVPKSAAFTLELCVEEGVLEAHGVVVAPSLKGLDLGERDRLDGPGTARGNLFALDIEASCDTLEFELQKATVATCRQRCALLSVGSSAR